MTTLSDVARLSGVSPMTASRVLSGARTSDAARDAVLSAARELGYVPNDVARGLRASRTGLVALVISDIENGFYGSIARSAERALHERGLRLTIASSDEDPERELELLTAVRGMRADALLITPTPDNGDELVRLRAAGIAVVQLDRTAADTDLDRVLLDNAAASRAAVEHLAAHGHRRIALISGPAGITTGAERARGALDAAARLPGVEVRVVESASYLHDGARSAVDSALDDAPTALVAGNNLVLEAVLDTLAARGIRAPDDLSIVSFDDLPWMRWTAAPISALRQPVARMAAAAVDLLMTTTPTDARSPAPPAVERRFEAELVERASVAAPPA
ncbi:LacI family DNA-binding transcriptional regulator [Galbitalea sp. SE-J8]|uniref:LacI family DNA-binding transcriptional regulator n=1 Tax=Galbitalea sp. SE-J8 TaxID=3054952 RepID=UPI00259CFE83|nr:LacI family DNA-binding transcriptional regulator [Galbitalea sp. SE-J8]MDM4761721.1 LacI family DNA-binding transcriptional regulator [Galbitalea sp. SE-J8]